jgi:ATP-dependent DNA helicase RecG
MPIYHYIFTTYGTWLHGDERGSINRKGKTHRQKHLQPDPLLEAANRRRLKYEPITLDDAQRQCVDAAIRSDCGLRDRDVRALNVRTTHVHAVIAAADSHERVLNDIKTWATRALRDAGLVGNRPVWASGGYQQACASPEAVGNAIDYVRHGQSPDLPKPLVHIPGRGRPGYKDTMDLTPLTEPLDNAVRITARVAPALGRLKIKRVIDLLNHFPRSYNQRVNISQLKAGMYASITGNIVSADTKATKRSRMKLTEVHVSDDTGTIKAIWFNQPWMTGKMQTGVRIRVSGPVDYSYNNWSIKPTAFELNPPPMEPGLEAEYPLSDGITNEDFAPLIASVINRAALIPDPLPEELARQLRLMPIAEAYRHAHSPGHPKALDAARLALKFREFFLLQAGLRLRRRSEAGDDSLVIKVDNNLRQAAIKYFPFKFTAAQRRVCGEIEYDLVHPGRMHRLLQGDVGSGKTAVALFAALLMIDNGYQCAIMAPTEVLARQHFTNISNYLRDTRVKVGLLLGGMKKAARDDLMADLRAGKLHTIIGTHALLEDYVLFDRLGLCVIDEQHKFGVAQRATLRAKGNRPHILAMSATPIPRTLSMTLYGALDVSVIDELPPGRTPVITEWIHRSREAHAYERIRKELKAGGRAYFVYPLVDDSDKLELKSATSFAQTLKETFPEFRVGLVHGQMDTDEKDAAVQAFRDGKLDILAATVVVEVGVDVPEANIMVIENAERFGLSQLHQLRGRVGRGRKQSYLYLFGDPKSEEAVKRLNTICMTHDGFRIAEEDLRMRGFGDFAGTRQSGLPKLHIGDFESDVEALHRARKDAAIFGDQMDEDLVRQCLELHFGRKYRLLDV